MAESAGSVTTMSRGGQVILPKSIRDAHRWAAGTRLLIENTSDGVLLRAAPLFETTSVDEVFGCLAREGEPRSIEEMDVAVLAEARRRAGD